MRHLSQIVREAYNTAKNGDEYISLVEEAYEENGYKELNQFSGGWEDWLVKELESGEIFRVDMYGDIDRVILFQNPCDLGDTYDWEDSEESEYRKVLISTVDENWDYSQPRYYCEDGGWYLIPYSIIHPEDVVIYP